MSERFFSSGLIWAGFVSGYFWLSHQKVYPIVSPPPYPYLNLFVEIA
jgi:hypothetical protein